MLYFSHSVWRNFFELTLRIILAAMVISIIFAASPILPDKDILSSLLRAILVAMDIPRCSMALGLE